MIFESFEMIKLRLTQTHSVNFVPRSVSLLIRFSQITTLLNKDKNAEFFHA